MAILKGRGNGFIISTDVPGAVGTIPIVENHTMVGWLPTDLYDGETLYNTSDLKKYTRIGNSVFQEDIQPVPTFDIESVDPTQFDSNTTGNVITITGTGLTGATIVLEDTLCPGAILNQSFTIVDDNMAQLTFDVGECDWEVKLIISKNGYIWTRDIGISPPPPPLEIVEIIPNPVLRTINTVIDIYLDNYIENLTNVEIGTDLSGGAVAVLEFSINEEVSTPEQTVVRATLDTAGAVVGEGSFGIIVTADGATTPEFLMEVI